MRTSFPWAIMPHFRRDCKMEWGDGYCRGGPLPPTVRICTVPERRSLKKTGALAPVLKFLSCFSSAQAPYPSFLPKAAKTRSFRCVCSSHRTRFAGLRRAPCSCPPQSRRNPENLLENGLKSFSGGRDTAPPRRRPHSGSQRRTWGFLGLCRQLSLHPAAFHFGKLPLIASPHDFIR